MLAVRGVGLHVFVDVGDHQCSRLLMMAHFVFTHFWLISSFMHQIKVINTMRLILNCLTVVSDNWHFQLSQVHAQTSACYEMYRWVWGVGTRWMISQVRVWLESDSHPLPNVVWIWFHVFGIFNIYCLPVFLYPSVSLPVLPLCIWGRRITCSCSLCLCLAHSSRLSSPS